MNTFYKPSGKFSPLSLVYLAIGSVTVTPLLALIYAQATIALLSIGMIFFIVNIIVTALFGALVGGIVMSLAVVHWGKMRNVMVATVLGLLAGLIAYYWQWVFYLHETYYTEDTVVAIVQAPAAVLAAIRDLLQTGTFTLEKNTVNGFLLLIIWLIEATIIIGASVLLARKKAEEPFSEKRGKWAKEIKLGAFEYIEPEDAEKIKAGDHAPLFGLHRGSDKDHHSNVTLFDAFDGDWYISIEDNFGTVDKKGKLKFEEIPVLKYAAMGAPLANYLQNAPILPSIPDESNEPETPLDVPPSQPNDAYSALYDTEKTKVIAGLLQVLPDQRTDDWHQRFHENILHAAFDCGQPQVIQGPDGLPYFMLKFPESKKKFNPFSLVSIKDHVIKKGFGVALSQDGQQVIWSIPHGAMVNLHLNGELFTAADHSNLPEREVLKEKTVIYHSQPSESFLPTATREVLKDFLQAQGIAEPQVTLMLRERTEGPSAELVFNIFAEDFETDDHFIALMNQVRWFLPQHYVLIAMPKNPEHAKTFKPL